MIEYITQIDFYVLDFIQKMFGSAFLNKTMPVITLLGEHGIACIIIAVALLLFKKTRKAGLTVSIAIITGFIICNLILKPTVMRIRPYDLKEGIALLVPRLSDYSFPSGHTVVCAETAVALCYFNKKVGIVAIILSVLVAFSRLYLYVHFPSDVIVGYILGVVIGIGAAHVVNRFYKIKEG